MEKALQGSPFVTSINKGDLIVEFDTKSSIQFYSADAYDSIRGETFDALIAMSSHSLNPKHGMKYLKLLY